MKDHPKVNYGKTGVILVNLGTPDSTSWWDVRKSVSYTHLTLPTSDLV